VGGGLAPPIRDEEGMMKRWSTFLVAILPLTLLIGCAGAKKTSTVEKESVPAVGPKVSSEGALFSFKAPTGAKAVYLAGEFNGWRPDLDLMSDEDGDGVWTITYPLDSGTYQYKFVADGQWFQDPNNPEAAPDGFGGNNSVLVVP
jgi:hypothetical protein